MRFGDLEMGFVMAGRPPLPGFHALPGVAKDGDWVMCVRDAAPAAATAGVIASPVRMKSTSHLPFGPPYEPLPPAGYRALSRVTYLPGMDYRSFACVRDDHCRAADWIDGQVVLAPYEGGDEVFLLPPHHQTITRPPCVLALPVTSVTGRPPARPRLSGRDRPETDNDWELYRSTWVPFPAVRDAGRGTAWRVANTPFYRLELWRRFELVSFLDNETSVTQRLSDTWTVGVARTTTDTFLASTTITVSGETGIGVPGVNVRGSASVAVTLGYQHSVAVAQMESRTVTRQIDVPADHAGAIFAENHRLVVRRADGSMVHGGELTFKANQSFIAVQYPRAASGSDRLAVIGD
nr:hypothetical protein [Hamadaea tsunoensis]